MRVAFYTLGCKVNQYETEVLSARFAAEGFDVVPGHAPGCDVYVVGSCTVTAEGDRKTRQAVRRFRRENPGAIVVLTGCYPQAFPREAAAVTEADIVTGALGRAAEDERRRGITVVGPHRDEISFSIDGREARDFASQGQQRSLVLAWKIAEAEVASDILGRYPMLLLDDVMSELDARRREAITGFVQGEIQTIITTTNLGYFSNDVIDRAKVVHIDGEKK